MATDMFNNDQQVNKPNPTESSSPRSKNPDREASVSSQQLLLQHTGHGHDHIQFYQAVTSDRHEFRKEFQRLASLHSQRHASVRISNLDHRESIYRSVQNGHPSGRRSGRVFFVKDRYGMVTKPTRYKVRKRQSGQQRLQQVRPHLHAVRPRAHPVQHRLQLVCLRRQVKPVRGQRRVHASRQQLHVEAHHARHVRLHRGQVRLNKHAWAEATAVREAEKWCERVQVQRGAVQNKCDACAGATRTSTFHGMEAVKGKGAKDEQIEQLNTDGPATRMASSAEFVKKGSERVSPWHLATTSPSQQPARSGASHAG
jgi:hypothetical protein